MSQTSTSRRTIIVSDLHLGLGRLPETGRFHHLESFFFDLEFGEFIDWLIADCTGQPARLVLAGDIIDYLRIDTAPNKRGQPTQVEQRGHRNKRGLGFTDASTVWKTRRVTETHDRFFAALARWIDAGNDIVWLPGNHDPEVRFVRVQGVLHEAIAKACERVPSRIGEALTFLPWFFYEPGRVWIEHGNQCDPENAFAFPLSEDFPNLECRCFGDELDMPLGSWFQRYVYNGIGKVTFQIPAVNAQRPYAFWLLFNRPHALWKLVRSQTPLWRRLIKEPCNADHSSALEQMEQSNTGQIAAMAESNALSPELLEGLSRLSAEPNRPVDVVAAVVRRTFRTVGARVLVLGLTAFLLSIAYVAVMNAAWGTLAKGMTLFVLALVPLAVFFGAAISLWLASMRPDASRRERAREYAARVAGATGVRTVVLGHFHSEDRWPLGDDATYVNTGTWVPVWERGDQLRDKVQFTFCDLVDQEATLRYWDPQAGRARRVILMEE